MNNFRSTAVIFKENMPLRTKLIDSNLSIRYTFKMLRALTMVANSRLRSAQEELIFARVAKNNLEDGWKKGFVNVERPLSISSCVIGGDRRLTGSLNPTLFSHVRQVLRASGVSAGDKTNEYGKRIPSQIMTVGSQTHRGIFQEFGEKVKFSYQDVYAGNSVPFSQSLEITSDLVSMSQKTDRVDIHYCHYFGAQKFRPVTVSVAGFEQSLQCEAAAERSARESTDPNRSRPSRPHNTIGGQAALRNFWEFRLAVTFHHAHCEARAVETSSRITTMSALISPKTIKETLARSGVLAEEEEERYTQAMTGNYKMYRKRDLENSFLRKRDEEYKPVTKPRSEANKLADIKRRTEGLRSGVTTSTSLRDLVIAIAGKDLVDTPYEA